MPWLKPTACALQVGAVAEPHGGRAAAGAPPPHRSIRRAGAAARSCSCAMYVSTMHRVAPLHIFESRGCRHVWPGPARLVCLGIRVLVRGSAQITWRRPAPWQHRTAATKPPHTLVPSKQCKGLHAVPICRALASFCTPSEGRPGVCSWEAAQGVPGLSSENGLSPPPPHRPRPRHLGQPESFGGRSAANRRRLEPNRRRAMVNRPVINSGTGPLLSPGVLEAGFFFLFLPQGQPLFSLRA